ncbi:hypothetical protein [Luteolibacter sp. LG18]|uniref:hypothetical protein n=1 Tax=Luteolibacter sp. LG18 TaxID=2819286 RepID=UPI0030C77B2D
MVRLSIEPAGRNTISFARCVAPGGKPDPEPYYAAAVTFGIRNALRKVNGRHQVDVLEIMTTYADSTDAAVAFAASQAVFEALELPGDAMILDVESVEIRIPM